MQTFETSCLIFLRALNKTNVMICSNETFCSQMHAKKVSLFLLIRQVLGYCENTIILDDQNHIHLFENRMKKDRYG